MADAAGKSVASISFVPSTYISWCLVALSKPSSMQYHLLGGNRYGLSKL
jgi:hypothetical protein